MQSGEVYALWTHLCTLSGYHDRTIYSAHWSRDDIIASGAGDDSIRLFVDSKHDSVDGPSYNLLLKKEKAHEMDVNSVQWSPNGTISFGAGFFFVVIGWPIIGMMLETNGFFVLFSGFWPTVAVFAQKIPILGWIIQQPYIRSFFDKYRGKRVLQAVIGRPQACSFHYV